MALNDLLVLIGADTSGLDNALKKAGAGLATFAKASAAAAVAVSGSLAAMTLSGLKLGNEIEILARRANATPEAFQRMAAGARRAGIDSDGLSDILQDVNDKIGDFMATGAGGMADFFENIAPRVGVTADMFRKLSGPQALQLYVTSLERAGLNQQEMTFYMEALASESTRLLPLLRNGGIAMQQFGDEAQAAGQILSTDVLQSLKNADAAIGRMGNVFITLRNQLAVEMAPILEKVANQFNELAQSSEVQDAISRLAGAFGDLAEIILSDDFIQVAIDGLAGLANISASVAEGMVSLSQNIEVVTLALSGLAIAVALAGGPFTIIIRLLAAALGGIALWRKKAEEAATSTDTFSKAARAAAEAERELNMALNTFSATAAPAAGKEAIAAAKANVTLAESAYAAAAAELEKRRAIEMAGNALLDQNPLTAGGNSGMSEDMARNTSESAAALEEASGRLQTAQDRFKQIANRVMSATSSGGTSGVGGVTTPPTAPPTTPDTNSGGTRPRSRADAAYEEYFGPVDIEAADGAAGISTADQLREQLEQRLEVLTEGLATESEVVAEWYEEGQTVLEDALAKGLLTEEEYREQRERLEEEHQKRMNAIKKAGAASDLATVAGAGANILSAIGQNNKKALKIAKVFSAAQALINTYQGASKELAKGGIDGFAAAAAVIAQGIGFVNAIKSVGDNGTGGGSGSTGTSSAASAPAAPTQTVSINLQGDTFSRGSVEGLLEQIQSQLDRGGRLVFA